MTRLREIYFRSGFETFTAVRRIFCRRPGCRSASRLSRFDRSDRTGARAGPPCGGTALAHRRCSSRGSTTGGRKRSAASFPHGGNWRQCPDGSCPRRPIEERAIASRGWPRSRWFSLFVAVSWVLPVMSFNQAIPCLEPRLYRKAHIRVRG